MNLLCLVYFHFASNFILVQWEETGKELKFSILLLVFAPFNEPVMFSLFPFCLEFHFNNVL